MWENVREKQCWDGECVPPGSYLWDVFQLEEKKEEVRVAEFLRVKQYDYTFYVYRVLLHIRKAPSFLKGLEVIKNELVPLEAKGSDLYLDFIFWEGMWIGVLPVLFKLNNETISLENLKRPSFAMHIKLHALHYYDFSDLWFDLGGIQPGDVREEGSLGRHLEIIKKVQAADRGLSLYVGSVYGKNASCLSKIKQSTYVLETIKSEGFHYYQPFSLPKLLRYYEDARKAGRTLAGKAYLSMPSAYVPGKFVDMEYYNAILGGEFGLSGDDLPLVVGYGAGIELVHVAKRCKRVTGVEVNPFAVASARVNASLCGVGDRVEARWEDVREYLMEREGEPFDKLMWNMPYEGGKEKGEPLRMRDFYDAYPVFGWFLPLLRDSWRLGERMDALLWNLAPDMKNLEEMAESNGFSVKINEERNFFVLSR